MAAAHGGYRAPSNPNVASGPGAYSRRTDGGAAQVLSAAPDQPYGAVKQQLNAQRVQPMAGTDPLPPPPDVPDQAPQQPSQLPAYTGGPFGGPTARPDEPVTAGAASGPGPGPEVLSGATPGPQAQGTGAMAALLQRLSASDTTGVLGQLMVNAQRLNV